MSTRTYFVRDYVVPETGCTQRDAQSPAAAAAAAASAVALSHGSTCSRLARIDVLLLMTHPAWRVLVLLTHWQFRQLVTAGSYQDRKQLLVD